MTLSHETPESGHSIYSPSKAHRYLRCPGSVALEEIQPDSVSDYALEGTAAHMLAEWVLTSKIASASEMLNDTLGWEEQGKNISWTVTADMVDYVQGYVDTIHERVEEFKMLPKVKAVNLHVEQRVDFSNIIGIPNQSGTADIVIEVEFEDDTVLLSVEDLKYGMGVKVDAEDNEQLMTYGAGVMDAYELVGYDVVKVNLAIHQIRLKHLSEFTYDAAHIRNFGRDLATQGKLAEHNRQRFKEGTPAEKLVLNPGEKQCRFCKAKAHCPAIAREVLETVIGDFDDETNIAEEVKDTTANLGGVELKNLSRFMQAAPLIEGWIKAVRARVEAELFDGKDVPGFKLVEGKRGSRAWVDEDTAEEALKSMRLKQEEMYTRKIISPTQTEKLLKSSPRRWNRLQDLITQSEGKPSVALQTDKRPALVLSPASEDFDDLDDLEDLV